MRMLVLLVLGLAMSVFLFSCGGKQEGESCSWEGSGFTASHDCGFGKFCLSSVDCPATKTKKVTPVSYGKCVRRTCKQDGDCEATEYCIFYSENASYCIPKAVCQ